jgi:hypothetical protein
VEDPFLAVIEMTAHGVNDVKQTEIHTAGPLVSDLSAFKVKVAIEKLKIQFTRYCTKYSSNPSRTD